LVPRNVEPFLSPGSPTGGGEGESKNPRSYFTDANTWLKEKGEHSDEVWFGFDQSTFGGFLFGPRSCGKKLYTKNPRLISNSFSRTEPYGACGKPRATKHSEKAVDRGSRLDCGKSHQTRTNLQGLVPGKGLHSQRFHPLVVVRVRVSRRPEPTGLGHAFAYTFGA